MYNLILYVPRKYPERIPKLQSYFSHPSYQFNIVDITNPNLSEVDQERVILHKCLHDARQNYPNTPVLFLRDTAITVASPTTVHNVVQNVLQNSSGVDVAYLSKWLDRCDQYGQPISETPVQLYQLKSPHGLLATVFFPSGIDKVLNQQNIQNVDMFLNQNIQNGNLVATGTVPNLFSHDQTLEYEPHKSVECIQAQKYVSKEVEVDKPNPNMGVLVFILVIILLLVILYLVAVQSKLQR